MPTDGVRPGVADHARPQGGERAGRVAPGPHLDPDRVALGVHEQRLFAGERALDGPLQNPRGQRGVSLVAHVLLAPEGAAVGDQLDGDRVGGHAEHGGDLIAVVPHALSARPHVQRPAGLRRGEGGLGLEEGVLDALRLEDLVENVGARRQRRVHVPTLVGGERQDVAVQLPHRVLGLGRHRRDRVGDRTLHVVAHVHQRGRPPGGLHVGGDDDGEHVAEVGRAAADRDHHWPVGVDDPDPQVAGDVGGGEHGLDPGLRQRGGRVDREDVGAGVLGEAQRGVQHAGQPDVVDIGLVAEHELIALVADAATADAPLDGRRRRRRETGRLRHGAVRQRLDGVEDLDVPRAAAQVGAEMAGRVLAGEIRPLLVDEALCSQHDAGDAEPALEGSAFGEGLGVATALILRHALQGDHVLPLGAAERHLARHDGLAVEQDGAAPALAARGAPVLGARDAELLAEGGQEVGMIVGDLDLGAVEHEQLHELASTRSTPANSAGNAAYHATASTRS